MRKRIWLKRLWLALLLVGGMFPVEPALTQLVQDRQWCDGEEAASLDQRIAACTAVIRSGRERGEKLAEAYHHRGNVYALKLEDDRAVQDYSAAIRLNPRVAAAYNDRGVAHDRRGDYDRAITDYDSAIRLAPSAVAHFNRGNAYLSKSQYDHAIDEFNHAIRLKPDFAAAFDNRCWARAVVGILRPALADCNQALRLAPNNPATLDSRAFIFLKMTQFDAAVSDYDAALSFDPKLAFALYGRGIAKLKNDDEAGAADIAVAKEIQADIADEYARYGVR